VNRTTNKFHRDIQYPTKKEVNMMTPESLDKWLGKFGKSVSMRTKNGSKQCSIDDLRKYIKQAIDVAVKREVERKAK